VSSVVNALYWAVTWRCIAFPPAVEDNQNWIPIGPRTALSVNLPNSITLIRIFSIPLLMWILSSGRFSSVNGEKELLASALFIAASVTDGIDGYLARKRGQITTMGILLDPLADKLLIAAAFITLVQLNPSLVPAWIAVIVIGREFLVSGLRSIAASDDDHAWLAQDRGADFLENVLSRRRELDLDLDSRGLEEPVELYVSGCVGVGRSVDDDAYG